MQRPFVFCFVFLCECVCVCTYQFQKAPCGEHGRKCITDNISFCRPKCDTFLSITVTIIETVEPLSINQFIPCATANHSGQGGRNGQQFAFRLDNNHVQSGCERKCASEAVLEPKRVQPSPADGTVRYGCGLQQAAIIDTGAQ